MDRYKYNQTSYRHWVVPRAAWKRHTSAQDSEQPLLHTQAERLWDCDIATPGPLSYSRMYGFPVQGPSASQRLKSLPPLQRSCRWVQGGSRQQLSDSLPSPATR